MAASLVAFALMFLIGLVISSLIIYAIASLLGEKEGGETAVVAALIGTIIYVVAYLVIGEGFIASIVGGVFWLAALTNLYNMGWPKATGIAILVWVSAAVVGVLVPTAVGPL